MKKHIFMVCAYKESPYLEDCIASLEAQEIQSEIMMCTSTPNEYITDISQRHQIPLIVNENEGDIQIDWNYAYRHADAEYVTLVHQDDVYNKEYTKRLYAAIQKYDDIVMYYTNYRPLYTKGNESTVRNDANSILRGLLSWPMLFPFLADKTFWKKSILRLGNSVCCSSVTYHKNLISEEEVFTSELRYSLDWDTFLKLAYRKGRFFYDKKFLTCFRIHEKSTSKLCIDNNFREKEDYIMFYKLWPKPIANFIMIFYRLAYKNYE